MRRLAELAFTAAIYAVIFARGVVEYSKEFWWVLTGRK